MLDDLYNKRILELAGNIGRIGRLAEPDGSATAHSKLCGSTVTVDLKLASGRVVDYAQDVKACALGQASSAIMAEHVVGADIETLRALRKTVTAMLKVDGPAPGGEWSDFAILEPVRAFKHRHASTLLVLEATERAIDAALAKSGVAA